ncbi:Dinoflagellate viral nucleoprotein 5 (DNVP5) [Durusdinium trenchii]|uniref:Dinoflagellate viral nucleoprotein 5 (DNVP5) n=1 Tax=Durusdinium trenchii TaxID=1381693 RepID=A0ABP0HXF9_9DINO
MKGMKAMKAMKAPAKLRCFAMKAMKSTMKKAMKKSTVAKGRMSKVVVLRGSKKKTSGGLTKDKLMKNKRGKVAASAAAKKRYNKTLVKWNKAVMDARKADVVSPALAELLRNAYRFRAKTSALGIKGFCAIGGKSAQGKALYVKAKSLYAATQQQLAGIRILSKVF